MIPHKHYRKRVRIDNIDCLIKFLLLVRDKLVAKKEQADLLLEYVYRRSGAKGMKTTDREIAIATRLHELNRRGE